MASDHPVVQVRDWRRVLRGLALLVAVYLVVVYVIPRPASVKVEGWRLTGIFLATIAGSIIEPLPAGALVLTAVTIAPLTGALTIEQSLGGYADKTVWLVIAAFIMSHPLLSTGLARRIALLFVRRFGGSTLGVAYSLGFSDAILAAMIPSNGARAGGVILPIARSIAGVYGSEPGPTARKLGGYLMTSVYQTVCVDCAMFYTGQASNPLAARLAADMGYRVTWASWFLAGIVPGMLSLLVTPWVVIRMCKPEIVRTPEAADFARRELAAMGPMKRNEWILTAVFAAVCGLWVSSSWTKIDITVTALMGGVVLLFTGVLTWEDVKSQRAAWDIFVWYGGLLRLGQALSDQGVTRAFAEGVGHMLSGFGWAMLFAGALLIYFYAHYAFASVTTHMISMFAPFVVLLVSRGAPQGLMVYAFACFANLAACLTNYGTTPGPMFFAANYVSLKDWWRVGLVASFVNITIWSTVGFAWWKLLRIW
jgi:DASS family divalent anion:Na+ symporter